MIAWLDQWAFSPPSPLHILIFLSTVTVLYRLKDSGCSNCSNDVYVSPALTLKKCLRFEVLQAMCFEIALFNTEIPISVTPTFRRNVLAPFSVYLPYHIHLIVGENRWYDFDVN